MGRGLTLDDHVQYVKGVGPARATALATLGIRTVGDLIEHLPFRHELRPKSVPIGALTETNQPATIVGQARRIRARGPMHKLTVSAEVVDGTGVCDVRWFNTPYLVDRLHDGQVLRLTGKISVPGRYAAMVNPRTEFIDGADDPFAGDRDRHDPVYPACAGIRSTDIARVISGILEDAVRLVADFVPPRLRAARRLVDRRTALIHVHRPDTPDQADAARRSLAYDEFLLMQLAVRMRRRVLHDETSAPVITTTDAIDRRIRARLPFAPTAGQERAIRDIRTDLSRPHPMNRLLQADVGAGKTAVAVYAALTSIANKRQAAILAPTEVLATQHRAKFEHYLHGSRVRVGFLSGSTRGRERQALLDRLRDGSVDLLIGTHAIIEADVRFHDLGLVVIDEQHKFGVAQRARLRSKGRAPHALVLTATPIPRTLAMTVFGDLDVSVIHDLPPGRLPVETRLVGPDGRAPAWADIRARLDAGAQAFIVYPLVEESDALPLRAATAEAQRLARDELAGREIGVLHGRMKPADKAAVMDRFRAGRIRVLVTTTVVEVGIDVPDATVMVIEHAEHYGLSQLHQLRGRVGRGRRAGTCILLTDSRGGPAYERLRFLRATHDGFRIAEEDLRLRGPGELLGTQQHGPLRIGALARAEDIDLLMGARDDAAAIIDTDPRLARPEHRLLRDALRARYGDVMTLIDVA